MMDWAWDRFEWCDYLAENIAQAALEEMRVRSGVERLREMLVMKTVSSSFRTPTFPGFPWDSLDWAAWGY